MKTLNTCPDLYSSNSNILLNKSRWAEMQRVKVIFTALCTCSRSAARDPSPSHSQSLLLTCGFFWNNGTVAPFLQSLWDLVGRSVLAFQAGTPLALRQSLWLGRNISRFRIRWLVSVVPQPCIGWKAPGKLLNFSEPQYIYL